MALHLTSCERAREPGFSRSECLELARQIEQGDMVLCQSTYEDCEDCGRSFASDRGSTLRQRSTIVAALRAYTA